MRLVSFRAPDVSEEERDEPAVCEDCGLSSHPCCSGGWVGGEIPGTFSRCPNYALYLRRRALERCGIPAHYRGATLDSFRTAKLRGGRQLAENLAACRAWLDAFTAETPLGLLLAGPPGTGKTHLAAALLQAAIAKEGVSGRFEDWTALVYALQQAIDRDKAGREGPVESDILRPALTAGLLVLDDIGARRVTAYQTDLLYLVVNRRYGDRLPTLFTTNLLPGRALEGHVGARTYSRLHECCRRPFLTFERCDDFRKIVPNA